MKPRLKFGNRSIPLPATRLGRLILGTVLIVGGILGFLPILGFWMIPVGVIILSIDLPSVRKYRRRVVVWWLRRKKKRERPLKPALLSPPKRLEPVD